MNEETNKDFYKKIYMMRQWLNEDRIDDPKKMVSNEDLLYWFQDILHTP